MSDLYQEIEIPPYKAVIEAEIEAPHPDGCYYARAVIARLDDAPVHENFATYKIERGDLFGDPPRAFRDAEERVREAIALEFLVG
ncbi:MAG: hypothetical protein WCA85_06685 [Paraburkholderia sp.]|uniref:hypothetical protein n=1 Tax=Paraburkholderia sp. TaxID=1926495 RepID=UPI003C59E3F3